MKSYRWRLPAADSYQKAFLLLSAFWDVSYTYRKCRVHTNAEAIYPLFIKRALLNKRRIDFLSISTSLKNCYTFYETVQMNFAFCWHLFKPLSFVFYTWRCILQFFKNYWIIYDYTKFLLHVAHVTASRRFLSLSYCNRNGYRWTQFYSRNLSYDKYKRFTL